MLNTSSRAPVLIWYLVGPTNGYKTSLEVLKFWTFFCCHFLLFPASFVSLKGLNVKLICALGLNRTRVILLSSNHYSLKCRKSTSA